MQDRLLQPSVFEQKSGAADYTTPGRNADRVPAGLALGDAPAAAIDPEMAPMRRHFRSIQSVSGQVQDFWGLT
jgi:hypothetical protein